MEFPLVGSRQSHKNGCLGLCNISTFNRQQWYIVGGSGNKHIYTIADCRSVPALEPPNCPQDLETFHPIWKLYMQLKIFQGTWKLSSPADCLKTFHPVNFFTNYTHKIFYLLRCFSWNYDGDCSMIWSSLCKGRRLKRKVYLFLDVIQHIDGVS